MEKKQSVSKKILAQLTLRLGGAELSEDGGSLLRHGRLRRGGAHLSDEGPLRPRAGRLHQLLRLLRLLTARRSRLPLPQAEVLPSNETPLLFLRCSGSAEAGAVRPGSSAPDTDTEKW